MKVTTLGIDIAKSVFALHGVDDRSRTVLQKTVTRARLLETISKLSPCTIGMEACGGVHHWAREFEKMGHTVKLMHAKYVKPYVKTQKNDGRDAEAICEAMGRPNMRFVPVKTVAQQELSALLSMRALLVKQRTALVNHIRGLLTEMGIVFPRSPKKALSGLARLLDGPREHGALPLRPGTVRNPERPVQRPRGPDFPVRRSNPPDSSDPSGVPTTLPGSGNRVLREQPAPVRLAGTGSPAGVERRQGPPGTDLETGVNDRVYPSRA
nr:IS110 family transposase [Leptospirillum ferriphilum]